mmetsp:Transcript_21345/g.46647  ORF Transcript_21345/g.46647 Transcript_21345/m.46647 type:complete len:299 (+) Transcript_21345:127-1023(+)
MSHSKKRFESGGLDDAERERIVRQYQPLVDELLETAKRLLKHRRRNHQKLVANQQACRLKERQHARVARALTQNNVQDVADEQECAETADAHDAPKLSTQTRAVKVNWTGPRLAYLQDKITEECYPDFAMLSDEGTVAETSGCHLTYKQMLSDLGLPAHAYKAVQRKHQTLLSRFLETGAFKKPAYDRGPYPYPLAKKIREVMCGLPDMKGTYQDVLEQIWADKEYAACMGMGPSAVDKNLPRWRDLVSQSMTQIRSISKTQERRGRAVVWRYDPEADPSNKRVQTASRKRLRNYRNT